MREATLRAGLVLLAVVFSLGAVELYFRLFDPQALQPESIHEYVWGISNGLRPNVRQRWQDRDYDIEVATSSKRLRDREIPYAKPPGVARILALGDSFTFGFGVELEDSYAKVLERRLRESGRPVEVLNAGVPGWGTAQELVFFLEEGHRYDPDVVTLCFFANDPQDNVNAALFEWDGSRLRRLEPRKNAIARIRELLRSIPFLETVVARSHALNFVRMRVLHLLYGRIAEAEAERADDAPAGAGYAEALTAALFRELVATLERRGIPLVVFDVAGGLEALPRVADAIDAHAATGGVFRLHTKAFVERRVADPDATYLVDRHWNERGHALVAQMLLELFERNPALLKAD